ncbi:hypothetical protein GCM10009118_04530 [Wandonia haliotis]|uniref:Lipoprotein n=2 Tax=Wandonia haliotis TaxID=574963 RepID=A0ABP3XXL3_9FLAO
MKVMKLEFKTIAAALLIGGTAMMSTSCKKEGCTDPNANNYSEDAKKDDGSCTYTQVEGTVNKSGTLTADETWTADKIWVLNGKVYVPDGVTLTIQPGTIIKGAEGQESLASALIVQRGGILLAEGTASQPIIFTSILDNIKVGETAGTNLSRTDNEKWGGLAILGRAPISAQSGDTETNLEGIPAGDGQGLFGGTNPSDYSGKLKYISIRHGGISIGEGNELNGLTLGGVGSTTEISNIEIYATLDDGIECFGGTVDIDNALVYYQGDDGLDLDMNYSGTIENFIVIHGDGIGTDEGLEIDGPEGTTYTTGKFTLRNGLVKSDGATDGSPADFKDKAQGTIENVTFDYTSIGGKAIKIRTKYNDACEQQADALSRLVAGDLSFVNCAISETVSVYPSTAGACPTEVANDQTAAEGEINGAGSGATVSTSIFSWTLAAERGQL